MDVKPLPEIIPIIEVELSPVWRIAVNGQLREMDHILVAILAGIAEHCKLTHAARAAGITHRHARNLIKGWSDFLGAPLVGMKRGKGTTLTSLGERILWAGRRIESRLAPELGGLAADFAHSINEARGITDAPLVIHASHDFAVTLLRERLLKAGITVDLQTRGSFDALASLIRGDCAVAGFHVGEGEFGERLAARFSEILSGHDIRLFPLARRQQGFIVARGNPKKMHSVSDLARRGVRFINRQRGSGTRALLEVLLSAAAVDRRSITGYDNEEVTHSAIAALVAGRQADVGFGVEAAAKRFNLDFVPVVSERYFLAMGASNLARHDIKSLLAIATSSGFFDSVDDIPGYRSLRAVTADTPRGALGVARIQARVLH